MLDDDYPRYINVGFDRIPDHVDAAFALPAHSHHGKEKVYFFKGATRRFGLHTSPAVPVVLNISGSSYHPFCR